MNKRRYGCIAGLAVLVFIIVNIGNVYAAGHKSSSKEESRIRLNIGFDFSPYSLVDQPSEVETVPKRDRWGNELEGEFERAEFKDFQSLRINAQIWIRPFSCDRKIDRLILRYGFGRAFFGTIDTAEKCYLEISPKGEKYCVYSELGGTDSVNEFFVGWRLSREKEDKHEDFFCEDLFIGVNFSRFKLQAKRGWWYYSCYCDPSGHKIEHKTEIANVTIISPSIVWLVDDSEFFGLLTEIAFDYGILDYRGIDSNGYFYGFRFRCYYSFQLL